MSILYMLIINKAGSLIYKLKFERKHKVNSEIEYKELSIDQIIQYASYIYSLKGFSDQVSDTLNALELIETETFSNMIDLNTIEIDNLHISIFKTRTHLLWVYISSPIKKIISLNDTKVSDYIHNYNIEYNKLMKQMTRLHYKIYSSYSSNVLKNPFHTLDITGNTDLIDIESFTKKSKEIIDNFNMAGFI